MLKHSHTKLRKYIITANWGIELSHLLNSSRLGVRSRFITPLVIENLVQLLLRELILISQNYA
jgi:hypothetical protein